MGVNTTQASYLVIGGGFLGYWLFVLMFPDTALYDDMSVAGWTLWGMLGMALAAGLFAGRVTEGTVRNLMWIATGISAGLAIGAAIYEESANIIATVITATGAGLIGAGLFYEQAPLWSNHRQGPPADGHTRDDAPSASTEWIPAQQQSMGSQQQGVTIIRQPYR